MLFHPSCYRIAPVLARSARCCNRQRNRIMFCRSFENCTHLPVRPPLSPPNAETVRNPLLSPRPLLFTQIERSIAQGASQASCVHSSFLCCSVSCEFSLRLYILFLLDSVCAPYPPLQDMFPTPGTFVNGRSPRWELVGVFIGGGQIVCRKCTLTPRGGGVFASGSVSPFVHGGGIYLSTGQEYSTNVHVG